MTKHQLKFLKLLKKYKTLTAPEICKKLHIKKDNIYSTDYSRLLDYIKYPGWNDEFDPFINVEHYTGDEATSCKSEFSLTDNGIKYLNNHRVPKMHIFTIVTTILMIVIALLTLLATIL